VLYAFFVVSPSYRKFAQAAKTFNHSTPNGLNGPRTRSGGLNGWNVLNGYSISYSVTSAAAHSSSWRIMQ
jgi:hypothetical protein